MATIGIDAEIILDNQGYFVLPGTYRLKQPRIRKVTTRADGAESYVDLGAGKRVWSMVILCRNDLQKYDGTLQSFRLVVPRRAPYELHWQCWHND